MAAKTKAQVAAAKQSVDNTTQRATVKASATQAKKLVQQVAQQTKNPGSVQVNVPAAPAAPAPAAAPTPPPPNFDYFLNGSDILNFQTAYAKDQQTIANYAANAANLKSTLQQNTQNNLQQTSQNIESNDENMAARGMFQSSIHDGNLADITAASIQNQNNFNTAYNNGLVQLNTSLQGAQSDETNQINAANMTAANNAETLAIANGGTASPGSFSLSGFIPAAPAASSVATNPTPTMQNFSNLPSALTAAANQTGTYSGVAVGSNPSQSITAAAAPKAAAPTAAAPATIAGIKTLTPSTTGAPTTPVVPK